MKKKRILVVDDNKDFLAELKETLMLSGYDTVSFSTGPAALKAIKKIKPDIILLDLKMYEMSGLEVANRLKYSPETAYIPIIAMSAFYSKEEHEKIISIFQIQGYLVKPFNPLDVIAKVEMILEGK